MNGPAHSRLVIGVMTGTSIDALDAAAVRVHGQGLEMRAEFVRGLSRPLGPLAARLRAIAEQAPVAAGEIASVSREFSELHAAAVKELIATPVSEQKPALICAHGQTVFHQVPRTGSAPAGASGTTVASAGLTWQLLTPAIIAHRAGVPVVSDLRAADVAAGGQGAPITPLADWLLFRSRDTEQQRAVVNLGGFCNVTLLPGAAGQGGSGPEAVRGRDVCACNHILDTIARRVMGVPFDDGGSAALAAEVDDDALDDLLGVLAAQSAARRSLGTGDEEVMSWIGRHRTRLSGGALAASACEAIGQMIAQAVMTGAGSHRVLLAGGGVRNAALVRAIGSCCSCRVETTAAHGVPPEYREAVCMAVLGALCQDRCPITLSAVTGVSVPPVAGSWVIP